MDLFDTLATTLYPTNITEHNDEMSNHYNDERAERIAESVYEIVDSLSEEERKGMRGGSGRRSLFRASGGGFLGRFN